LALGWKTKNVREVLRLETKQRGCGLLLLAAGGIADARGIAAAFALGAQGVQMGAALLACEESGATTLHREAILSGKASRTSLTRGFTGRLARGIHKQLLEEMNRPDVAVLPYPLQRALMPNLAVPKCWDCPISRRSNASAIARQWSIRETCLRLGWSTPTGL
jgi:NAD(P)H-dependent flavin oxidoreductase YrpB (nitropropane dioxygenase family)